MNTTPESGIINGVEYTFLSLFRKMLSLEHDTITAIVHRNGRNLENITCRDYSMTSKNARIGLSSSLEMFRMLSNSGYEHLTSFLKKKSLTGKLQIKASCEDDFRQFHNALCAASKFFVMSNL